MAELDPAPRPDQPRSLPLLGALGGLKRGFEALGVRNYRLYWSGQVVSLVGTWMQQVSLPWLVLSLGGSPLQLGFVAVLQFGPGDDPGAVRRRVRRPPRQAAGDDGDPGRRRGPGVRAVRPDRHRGGRDLDGHDDGARPRLRERDRHAVAPVAGAGPRATPPAGQRDRAQLDGVQLRARRRAGAGRRDHRDRHRRHRVRRSRASRSTSASTRSPTARC